MLTVDIVYFLSRSKRAWAQRFRPLLLSFFLLCCCIKREPQTRVGLVTSSLPRKRSTTELLRLVPLHSLSDSECLACLGGGAVRRVTASWSGRRGSNPPPIAWKAIALPNELLPPVEVSAFRGGGWTRTTELFRGQIYSLLQLPLCDSPYFDVTAVCAGHRADEGTRTPDRLITNQLLYQLSYIGFIQPFKQLSFSQIGVQKYYFFRYWQSFFSSFVEKILQTIVNHDCRY